MVTINRDPRQAQKLFLLLDNLRSAMIRTAIVLVLGSTAGWFSAHYVLDYLIQLVGVELVAFGLPDTFFATLSLSVAIGFFFTVPYLTFQLMAPLPNQFPAFSRKLMVTFWLASTILFYSGALFCLKLTLPYGINYLLGFQTEILKPLISIRKFVSFCLMLIFGFGIIFELPLGMMLLSRLGIARARRLSRYRRYAVLMITILSAVLTPTPDILNMSLMAGPLYLLFELGLIGMRISEPKPETDHNGNGEPAHE